MKLAQNIKRIFLAKTFLYVNIFMLFKFFKISDVLI